MDAYGKRIIQALADAAFADDGEPVKAICRSIVDDAQNSDNDRTKRWSRQFIFDYLVGRPAQSMTLAGDPDNLVGAAPDFIAWLAASTGKVIDGETRQ